jgi:hypothetical protein
VVGGRRCATSSRNRLSGAVFVDFEFSRKKQKKRAKNEQQQQQKKKNKKRNTEKNYTVGALKTRDGRRGGGGGREGRTVSQTSRTFYRSLSLSLFNELIKMLVEEHGFIKKLKMLIVC